MSISGRFSFNFAIKWHQNIKSIFHFGGHWQNQSSVAKRKLGKTQCVGIQCLLAWKPVCEIHFWFNSYLAITCNMWIFMAVLRRPPCTNSVKASLISGNARFFTPENFVLLRGKRPRIFAPANHGYCPDLILNFCLLTELLMLFADVMFSENSLLLSQYLPWG